MAFFSTQDIINDINDIINDIEQLHYKPDGLLVIELDRNLAVFPKRSTWEHSCTSNF